MNRPLTEKDAEILRLKRELKQERLRREWAYSLLYRCQLSGGYIEVPRQQANVLLNELKNGG